MFWEYVKIFFEFILCTICALIITFGPPLLLYWYSNSVWWMLLALPLQPIGIFTAVKILDSIDK